MAGGTLCSTEKGFTVRVPELRSSTVVVGASLKCAQAERRVLPLCCVAASLPLHPSADFAHVGPAFRSGLRRPDLRSGRRPWRATFACMHVKYEIRDCGLNGLQETSRATERKGTEHKA